MKASDFTTVLINKAHLHQNWTSAFEETDDLQQLICQILSLYFLGGFNHLRTYGAPNQQVRNLLNRSAIAADDVAALREISEVALFVAGATDIAARQRYTRVLEIGELQQLLEGFIKLRAETFDLFRRCHAQLPRQQDKAWFGIPVIQAQVSVGPASATAIHALLDWMHHLRYTCEITNVSSDYSCCILVSG